MIVLLAGLDNDDEIAARSTPVFDYNSHMLKHLVNNNYDQKLGLLLVSFPTILQATNAAPFWSSYIYLAFGLLLSFTSIRMVQIGKRIKHIEEKLKSSITA